MYTKSWQIIKDDTTKTFEVCGQEFNTGGFENRVLGMQRVGMNVSCVITPITNKNASRTTLQIQGYTTEEGLQERLVKRYREVMMGSIDEDLEDFEE